MPRRSIVFRGLAAVCSYPLLTVAPAAAAAADAGPGPYVSFGGMYAMPDVAEATADSVEDAVLAFATSDIHMKNGFGAAAAFGYGADTGLRGEIEISWRSVDFDKWDGITFQLPQGPVRLPGEAPDKASLSVWSLTGNGIWAFGGGGGTFRPYIGAGAGVALVSLEEEAQTWRFSFRGRDWTIESEDNTARDAVFTWQALAGVAWPLTERAELRVGYRYFATAEATLDDIRAGFSMHSAEVGIRFRF